MKSLRGIFGEVVYLSDTKAASEPTVYCHKIYRGARFKIYPNDSFLLNSNKENYKFTLYEHQE